MLAPTNATFRLTVLGRARVRQALVKPVEHLPYQFALGRRKSVGIDSARNHNKERVPVISWRCTGSRGSMTSGRPASFIPQDAELPSSSNCRAKRWTSARVSATDKRATADRTESRARCDRPFHGCAARCHSSGHRVARWSSTLRLRSRSMRPEAPVGALLLQLSDPQS
jgi:hypothetical protein